MVYYLENYVTFYDDIFQLVHYVGNDVTAILVMIRELECLPWATLAVSGLLRFSISDHWLCGQWPVTDSASFRYRTYICKQIQSSPRYEDGGLQ